jgi:cation:H+ antiporter
LMLVPLLEVVAGIGLLLWSAGWFVTGAAALARHLGVAPLVIGMVVVGFGTSAPEIFVSLLSAIQGNPGLALGNAYGSNIANIGLILGVTALICPIPVASSVLRRELPVLTVVTALTIWLLSDLDLSRLDGALHLLAFVAVFAWTLLTAARSPGDAMAEDMADELKAAAVPPKKAVWLLLAGLVTLVASSRILVMGAVSIAEAFGVSDLVIGLTIVAVGTSLPELASSVVAARRGEHDLALGNVIGSNLFNTLAVVGIAGVVQPAAVDALVLRRDFPVMGGLTLLLFLLGRGVLGRGRINRIEGGILICLFAGYTAYVLVTARPG